MYAAYTGSKASVDELLGASYLRRVIDYRDSKGKTPLRVAARWGSGGVVACLVRWGADVNITCGQGNSPLHYASLRGEYDMVNSLLEAKAKVSLRTETSVDALWLIRN